MQRRTLLGLALAPLLLVGGAAYLFYPRLPSVPDEVLARSVERSPALLAKASELPAARALLENLDYQDNGSTCGPASLANLFRSLGSDVDTESEVLEGSGRCSFGVCFGGLTLDELAEVARRKTNRKVTVLRDLSLDDFRRELREANSPDRRVLVNFHRKPIFGQGGGHHSPIGGYLEEEKLVLVLDVNENYRPWLLADEKLFAAMDTFDGDRKRGLLRIE